MHPSLSRGSLPIWKLVLAMLLCGTANAQFTGKRRAHASSFWGGTGASGKIITWSALYVAPPWSTATMPPTTPSSTWLASAQ